MAIDLRGIALDLISRNPSIVNNPKKQIWVDAIRNGDSAKGEQIANSLLEAYGVRKEDIPAIAKQFFGF